MEKVSQMQLKDLVKPLDQMSDEELLARLREVRHNREVVRAARVKHVERAETKVSRGKVSAVEKLLAGLSETEKASLLAQLEQGDQNGGAADNPAGNPQDGRPGGDQVG